MQALHWVGIPFVPSLDELATISSWDMGRLMDKWKTDAGPLPDWEKLQTLQLADPPSYPIVSTDGPQMLRDAVTWLASLPGLTEDTAAGGIDIVPFVPWTGGEAVRPLEVEGRVRTLYAATWPIWSWTLLDPGDRVDLVRSLQIQFERGWVPGVAVYATALVDLCRQVILHRLPLRLTWEANMN